MSISDGSISDGSISDGSISDGSVSDGSISDRYGDQIRQMYADGMSMRAIGKHLKIGHMTVNRILKQDKDFLARAPSAAPKVAHSKIRAAYLKGHSVKTIAEAAHLSQDQVYSILHAGKVKLRAVEKPLAEPWYKERNTEIRQFHATGMTVYQLALKYQLTESAIYDIIGGIPKARRSAATMAQWQRWIQLYHSGLSTPQIAKNEGVSIGRVRYALVESGVRFRKGKH